MSEAEGKMTDLFYKIQHDGRFDLLDRIQNEVSIELTKPEKKVKISRILKGTAYKEEFDNLVRNKGGKRKTIRKNTKSRKSRK